MPWDGKGKWYPCCQSLKALESGKVLLLSMPLWLVVQSTSLLKWKWTRIWSKISILFNQTLQGSFLVLMSPPVKERSERVHLQRHFFCLYHPQTQGRYHLLSLRSLLYPVVLSLLWKCRMSELQFRASSAPLYWDSRVCSILEKNKDIKNNQDRYWSPIHTPLHWLTASSNQKGQSNPVGLQVLTETEAKERNGDSSNGTPD